MTGSRQAAAPAAIPTPREIVARAEAMRERLVELQAETEERTYYSQETHEEFLEAGFYRMLVPKRFGGYELDLATFWRVIIAIARGCPSTAWCLVSRRRARAPGRLALRGGGAGRALRRRELPLRRGRGPRRNGDPHRRRLGAEQHAPLLVGRAVLDALHGSDLRPDGASDGPPQILLFVAPRSSWTMLDDWGDTLGLKGSGSHSVRFENAHIPSHLVLENTWMVDTDVSRGTPGYRLHGNPMYAGRTLAYFQSALAAVMIGAAKGALDEYEEILKTRKTQRPPIVSADRGSRLPALVRPCDRPGRRGRGRAPRLRRTMDGACPAERRGGHPVLTRGGPAAEHDRPRGAHPRVERDAGPDLPDRRDERGPKRRAHRAGLPRHGDRLGSLRHDRRRLGCTRVREGALRSRRRRCRAPSGTERREQT